MYGHFNDVRKWFLTGQRTDTFARHFATHFSTTPKAADVRKKCSFKILQSINPFSYMKGVRTEDCRLCNAEKLWLFKKKAKTKVINENSEIYGPCRHTAKFHRFPRSSTDERSKREKSSIPRNAQNSKTNKLPRILENGLSLCGFID